MKEYMHPDMIWSPNSKLCKFNILTDLVSPMDLVNLAILVTGDFP